MNMENFWMMVNRLHCRNLAIQVTGRHLHPVHNLNWQSSYLSRNRCQQETLMTSWRSGLPKLQHQAMNHLFEAIPISTIQSTQSLLAVFPGNVSRCHMMVHDPKPMFRRGWKGSTRFTLGILASCYWICWLIQPLRRILIIHQCNSLIAMEVVVMNTSCLVTGFGSKRYVRRSCLDIFYSL